MKQSISIVTRILAGSALLLWIMGLAWAQTPGPTPGGPAAAPGQPGQPPAATTPPPKPCDRPKPGLRSSPWKERDLALKQINSPEGSVEADFAAKSKQLNTMDLRITPLDVRFEHLCGYLSKVRDGFWRIDPFSYPNDLPDELRSKVNRPLTKDAILARASAAFKDGVIGTLVIRGTFTINGKRKVLISGSGFGVRYAEEGDVLGPTTVDAIPPGGVFRTLELVLGTLTVDTINTGYILMKTSVYFLSDPQTTKGDGIVCYLAENSTYRCL